MSDTLTFDVALFREQFPAFASNPPFTDAMLQMYWDMATCYVSDENWGWLKDNCRQTAINLMTAHLTQIAVIVGTNPSTSGIPKIISGSTVDKVSITLTPPPLKDSQYRWWLSTTPYGAQLLALLQAKGVGGMYIGGLPETAAFRRVGGIFI